MAPPVITSAKVCLLSTSREAEMEKANRNINMPPVRLNSRTAKARKSEMEVCIEHFIFRLMNQDTTIMRRKTALPELKLRGCPVKNRMAVTRLSKPMRKG